jgi:RNA polymerase sigma-70 factor (ECF subfamily)
MALDSPTIVRLLMEERNRLFSYIWAIVGNAQLAEDVFQEVSLLVVEKGSELVDEPELKVWLRRAARYKALEAVRKVRRSPVPLDEAVVEKLEQHWAKYDATQDSELIEFLEQCVQSLTPNARKLVTLRYVKGLRSGQIADRLNRKVTTVRQGIARAHRNLYDCIRTRLAAKKSDSL